MNKGKYVFAQIMETLPRHEFDEYVERYQGERYAKNFSCRDQFLALSFGQLAYRESLRDVITCLSAQRAKLYHLGFRSTLARSTLAEANEKRDWRIYRDFAELLIIEAKRCYADDPAFTLDLDGSCYVIDSTSIAMCLATFPWAPYMQTHMHEKGAVKLHLLMDLHGSIPTFFHMTSGKVPDVYFLDRIVFEAGAYYMMDKGYHDYARFYAIHKAGAFFVTRAKDNMGFARLYSHACDTSTGLRCDQTIRLSGADARKRYPDTMRRIKYYDEETDRYYVFLTNNFTIPAQTVADLYKHRWQIELFFKWIKQHLKIKTFWGHSKNAVQMQICIALCTYLIVAILKKRLGIERNLYEILQILSVSLFDKTPLVELFSRVEIQKSGDDPQETLPLLGI
jgi:transposase